MADGVALGLLGSAQLLIAAEMLATGVVAAGVLICTLGVAAARGGAMH